MTLNQLIYFQKIAETGNMGRAAKVLHISQPSLSISIANLEKELNLSLFNRIGHKLSLSPEGEQLLIHAKTILNEIQETQLHMQSLSADRETHIRIGCITPVLYEKLPRIVHNFLAMPKNSSLKVDFATDNTVPLIAKLRDGYYDFLVCSAADDGDIIQTELYSEPYVLLCPPNSDIPQTWDELLSRDMIGFHTRAASHHEIHTMLINHGIQPTYIHRAPDEEGIAALVSNGFGYGIAARVSLLANYNLQIAPLPQPNSEMVRRIYLTQLVNRPPVGASMRFMNYLMKVMKEERSENQLKSE